MQLNKFDTKKKSNSGAFLHLVSPAGAKIYDVDADGNSDLTKPVGLLLLGKDSKAFEESRHKRNNDRLGKTITSELLDEDTIQMLAELTVGWRNLEVDGDSTFSKDNVIKLFVLYPWAKEQADVFIGNRANFI